MIGKLTLATACLLTIAAQAEERRLNGDEITALLPGIKAVSDSTVQTFSVSGSTLYVDGGRPSTGKWWATAWQYCSTWPPSSVASCYDVFVDESADPALLIWVDTSGRRFVNRIEPK